MDAEQILCGRGTERHDGLRLDGADLPHEKRDAGVAFVFFRGAILRGPAFHDIRYVHVFAAQAHGCNHIVQQLTGAADERQPLRVFIGTRAFADEHQLGLRIARTKDEIGAALMQAAKAAVADIGADGGELGSRIPQHRMIAKVRNCRSAMFRIILRPSFADWLSIQIRNPQLAVEVQSRGHLLALFGSEYSHLRSPADERVRFCASERRRRAATSSTRSATARFEVSATSSTESLPMMVTALRSESKPMPG